MEAGRIPIYITLLCPAVATLDVMELWSGHSLVVGMHEPVCWGGHVIEGRGDPYLMDLLLGKEQVLAVFKMYEGQKVTKS